jgi:hypothetical protein
MDFELIGTILFASVFILLLSIFVITIFSLPFLIRSLRISRLAKKYGLLFKSNLKLQIFEPEEEKINICEGSVFGKHIEIFDHIDYRAFSISLISSSNTRISSKKTVIIINGEKKQIKGGIFSGYASVSSVEKAILAIRNRDSDYTKTDIFNNYSYKNVPITYVLIVMIFIIAWALQLMKYLN